MKEAPAPRRHSAAAAVAAAEAAAAAAAAAVTDALHEPVGAGEAAEAPSEWTDAVPDAS